MDTRQSILVSGHKSCASLMAKIVGLFATIAPSCQRFTSRESEGKEQYKDKEKDYSLNLIKIRVMK